MAPGLIESHDAMRVGAEAAARSRWRKFLVSTTSEPFSQPTHRAFVPRNDRWCWRISSVVPARWRLRDVWPIQMMEWACDSRIRSMGELRCRQCQPATPNYRSGPVRGPGWLPGARVGKVADAANLSSTVLWPSQQHGLVPAMVQCRQHAATGRLRLRGFLQKMRAPRWRTAAAPLIQLPSSHQAYCGYPSAQYDTHRVGCGLRACF